MLRLDELSKTYLPPPAGLRPLVRTATRSPVEALRQVSLEVAAGEIVGLVGPNGAGKSTLIKIVGTLLHPTSGRAVVDGIDVAAHPLTARRRMGVVLPDDRGLYWRLNGRQNLELFARLRGESRTEARRQAGEMLARLGLPDDGRLVFGYSSGMRARLNLARAIGGGPKLLLSTRPRGRSTRWSRRAGRAAAHAGRGGARHPALLAPARGGGDLERPLRRPHLGPGAFRRRDRRARGHGGRAGEPADGADDASRADRRVSIRGTQIGEIVRRDGVLLLSYKFSLVLRLMQSAFAVLTLYFLSKLVESPAALAPYGGNYLGFAVSAWCWC